MTVAFAIFTSSRTYTLSAPSDQEAQEWINALLQASNLSTHRCEEELGLQPTTSIFQKPQQSATTDPTQPLSLPRSPSNLPPLDTSVPSAAAHSLSSAIPFTGVSPSSRGHCSQDVPRVASFESSGGYFSGAELGPSANEQGAPATPGLGPERTSFESDELEGLAEDRVVAQGYLLCLKNVSGVRQWKRRWVVLRGRSLTLYKNFEVLNPLLPFQFLPLFPEARPQCSSFTISIPRNFSNISLPQHKFFLSSPHPFLFRHPIYSTFFLSSFLQLIPGIQTPPYNPPPIRPRGRRHRPPLPHKAPLLPNRHQRKSPPLLCRQ